MTLTFDIIVGMTAPLISRRRVYGWYLMFVIAISTATVLALKTLGEAAGGFYDPVANLCSAHLLIDSCL